VRGEEKDKWTEWAWQRILLDRSTLSSLAVEEAPQSGDSSHRTQVCLPNTQRNNRRHTHKQREREKEREREKSRKGELQQTNEEGGGEERERGGSCLISIQPQIKREGGERERGRE